MGGALNLGDNGYWMLGLVVLADQCGLPLPAMPFLVGAGAMVRAGSLEAWPVLLLAVGASLIGHTAWYVAGRRRGAAVLRWVCEMSLEPDACVRRAQDTFARLGPWSLVAVRFLPGVDTMAQPLAGMSGMPLGRYLALSIFGAALWACSLIGAGFVFGEQIVPLLQARRGIGRVLLPLLGLVALAYLGRKLYGRWRALRDTAMARIDVDALKARLDRGDALLVVDLRHPLEARLYPHTVPGALRLTRQEVIARLVSGPAEQEVVLFCNCPYELGSARLALALARRGIRRVQPLEGGLDAWEKRRYPVVALTTGAPAARLSR